MNWAPPFNTSYSVFHVEILPENSTLNNSIISIDILPPQESYITIKNLTAGETYKFKLYTILNFKKSLPITSKNLTTNPNKPRQSNVLFKNETTLHGSSIQDSVHVQINYSEIDDVIDIQININNKKIIIDDILPDHDSMINQIVITKNSDISWKTDVNLRQQKFQIILIRNNTNTVLSKTTIETKLIIPNIYPGACYEIIIFSISYGINSKINSDIIIKLWTYTSVFIRWIAPSKSLFSEFIVSYIASDNFKWIKLTAINITE
ncbi:hypothetical protein HCN44_004833 [Aphidius gifuensis]|uniref:Fibronectin type-III domain-containing protein n=1 Tax=Aphidius gifuensis TaxID=684658 RepID=A0A835CQ36_APHGI|nr:hypothetical protein HCN44_004833 [Aphidius gifuensis]